MLKTDSHVNKTRDGLSPDQRKKINTISRMIWKKIHTVVLHVCTCIHCTCIHSINTNTWPKCTPLHVHVNVCVSCRLSTVLLCVHYQSVHVCGTCDTCKCLISWQHTFVSCNKPQGLDSSVGIAQLVEPRHVNPEVAGSSPALVNFSLFIQIYLKSVPSQFPLWFYYMTFI